MSIVAEVQGERFCAEERILVEAGERSILEGFIFDRQQDNIDNFHKIKLSCIQISVI